MKRIIAGLLSLVLLLTSFTGVAAAEVKLPYEYAPVTFFLNGQDLEDQFRQWAYEKVSTFREIYILASKPAFYDEYGKLARYKRDWYDLMAGEVKNIFGVTIVETEHTSATMTEDEKDESTLLAIIGTLEQYKKTDKNYMKKYLSMSKKERRRFVLNEDGKWEEDVWLKETQIQSDNKAALDSLMAVISVGDLAIETARAKKKVEDTVSGVSDSAKKIDIGKILTDAAVAASQEIVDTAKTNLEKATHNSVKKWIAQQAMDALSDVRYADMEVLKEIYISDHSMDERKRNAAQKLYDFYDSTAYEEQMKTICDEVTPEILASFNLELEKQLNSAEFIIKTAMDFLKDMAGGYIGALEKNIDKDPERTQGQKVVLKTLLDTAKATLNQVFDNIGENWKKTGKIDVTEWGKIAEDEVGSYISAASISKIAKEFNLVEIAKDVADSTSVSELKKWMKETKKPLSHRILGIIVYDLFLQSMEDTVDYTIDELLDIIDRENREITTGVKNEKDSDYTKLNNSIRKNARQTLADIVDVVVQYYATHPADAVKVADKIGLETKQNDVKKLLSTVAESTEIVAGVAEKAWKVGENIVVAAYSIRQAGSGEDGISLLAQNLLEQYNLRDSSDLYIRSSVPEFILDKDKMSVKEVWKLVANMKNLLKVDMIGTSIYMNIAIKNETGDYKNTYFMKWLRGEKALKVKTEYINILGKQGLLDYKTSTDIYNSAVGMSVYYNDGWNDAWLEIPGVLN